MKALRIIPKRRPPTWLLVLLSVPAAALVAALLLLLWSTGHGNLAGWVTTFCVYGACLVVWEALGLGTAFQTASRRTQRLVVALTLALAFAGGLIYVLLPG